MNGELRFGQALGKVLSYPVYLIFAVLLIVYAVLGSLPEALLLLLFLFLSAAVRAVFLCGAQAAFPKAGKAPAGTLLGSSRRIGSTVSVICTVCAVPLMILELILPDSGGFPAALGAVLGILALGLSFFCGAPGDPLSYLASLRLSEDPARNGGFSVPDPVGAEKIADCETALLLNPDLLYDRNPAVRAVYYAGALYRGYSLTESALKLPSELCELTGGAGSFPEQSREAELNNLLLCFGRNHVPDEGGMFFAGFSFDVRTDYPAPGDVFVTLYSDDGLSSMNITRTQNAGAALACRRYTAADGSELPLEGAAKDRLREVLDTMHSDGLETVCFVSDETGLEGACLQCVIGVGGTFPEENREISQALLDFGVHQVLALPVENRAALRFSSVCGLAGDGLPVRYSETREGADADLSRASTQMLLGFPRTQLRDCLRAGRKKGARFCAVLRGSSDFSLLSETGASVAVGTADGECVRVADASVSPAGEGEDGAGLGGLFSLLSECVIAVEKLHMFRNLMISYGITLALCFIVPLAGGLSALVPSASQLLLCGTVFSLCAVFSLAEDRAVLRSRSVRDREKERSGNILLRYAGLGLLQAVALCVTGAVVFSREYAAARSFLLCAFLLSGLSLTLSARLFSRRRYGVTGWNLTAAVCGLCCLLLAFAAAALPFPEALSATFGGSAMPWKVLAYSLIPAAVPPLYCAAEQGIAQAAARLGEKEAPKM